MIKWDNVATAVVTAIVMTVGAGAISKFTDGSIVGLLGGVPQSALAEEAGLSPDAPLSDVLAALKGDRVSEASGSVPSVGNHPNTKAIIAYVSDKGEKTCPEGWSPFEEAKDRFILGAGGAYPTVGQKGGEAAVTLSARNMPSHSHDTKVTKVAGIGGTFGAAKASGGNETINYSSSTAGGGLPHNNMPPYIALYYCKMD